MRHKRDDVAFLQDMIEACDAIIEYTSDVTYDIFSRDRKTVDAVIRRFTILGEAATQISKEFRAQYPEISWRDASDMRNVLVHFYHGADLKTVWDTAKNDLPVLMKKLKDIFSVQ